MRIEISYEQAMAAYPEQVKEAIAMLRKSRSKKRKADPASLKWAYNWGVETEACSFRDLLNGTALADDRKWHAMTVEERIDDEIRRSFVTINVHNGYYANLPDVPEEVHEIIRAHRERDYAEEQRVAAMTPEEKVANVQRLLGKLRGRPGFMELK